MGKRSNYIIKLCSDGNLDELKYKITKNGKLNIHEDIINYGLRVACENGHIQIVKFFVENYKKKIKIASRNNCCMRLACKNNRKDVVDYLTLHYKKDINIRELEYFILRWSCIKNYIDIIDHIMENYKNQLEPVIYKLLCAARKNNKYSLIVYFTKNYNIISQKGFDNYISYNIFNKCFNEDYKIIMNKYENQILPHINYIFQKCADRMCCESDTQSIIFIMENYAEQIKYMENNRNFKQIKKKIFCKACEEGNLSFVKYLVKKYDCSILFFKKIFYCYPHSSMHYKNKQINDYMEELLGFNNFYSHDNFIALNIKNLENFYDKSFEKKFKNIVLFNIEKCTNILIFPINNYRTEENVSNYANIYINKINSMQRTKSARAI